jgi:hypothetical protein
MKAFLKRTALMESRQVNRRLLSMAVLALMASQVMANTPSGGASNPDPGNGSWTAAPAAMTVENIPASSVLMLMIRSPLVVPGAKKQIDAITEIKYEDLGLFNEPEWVIKERLACRLEFASSNFQRTLPRHARFRVNNVMLEGGGKTTSLTKFETTSNELGPTTIYCMLSKLASSERGDKFTEFRRIKTRYVSTPVTSEGLSCVLYPYIQTTGPDQSNPMLRCKKPTTISVK